MNINRSDILSHSLSTLTYNGNKLKIPQDEKINIYMGIGLWSVTDKLSINLPIDVMHLLLSAAVLRSQISDANPGKKPKIIVLIADSMAVAEGAERSQVAEITLIYQQAISRLLQLLNLSEWTQIILSSDLERSASFIATLQKVQTSERIQEMDSLHGQYVCMQTAITQHLHTSQQVGIKIGWILNKTNKRMLDPIIDDLSWDELKFDRLHRVICPDSTLQCLYTKAGMKQRQTKHGIQVEECCPYTAFEKDERYVVGTLESAMITKIPKSISNQWKGIATVCSKLKDIQVVSEWILPKGCIKQTNDSVTVTNMLNHWINPSLIEKSNL